VSLNKRVKVLVATVLGAVLVGSVVHVFMLAHKRIDTLKDKGSAEGGQTQWTTNVRANEALEQNAQRVSTYQLVPGSGVEDPEITRIPMVAIPEGTFWMGEDGPLANDDEKPAAQIQLHAYNIDIWPVTNRAYRAFIVATGYPYPPNWKNGTYPEGSANQPATFVNWKNASDFCVWAGKRLPTEAEWERAARGDQDRRVYPWGDTWDRQRGNADYQVGHQTDVDAYPEGASPWGVLDMSGNVWEWCGNDHYPYEGNTQPIQDYDANFYSLDFSTPGGIAVAEVHKAQGVRYKVLRGGSWKSSILSARVSQRNPTFPKYASDFMGFRCASDGVPEVPESAHKESNP